jgi:hypothetical protein
MTDVIFTYPDNVIFPLFESWIYENRGLFNKIYLSIHKKNIGNYDYTEYIKKYYMLDDGFAEVVDTDQTTDDDWRNRAVNACLSRSTANKILFVEQDMFIKQEALLESLNTTSKAVYVDVYGRKHPCFMLVDRDLIDQTSRDFSAKPPEYDHFGLFTKELEDLEAHTREYVPNQDFFHMAGLTQNYTMAEMGEKPNHDLLDFSVYNHLIMDKNSMFKPVCELTERLLSPLMEFV